MVKTRTKRIIVLIVVGAALTVTAPAGAGGRYTGWASTGTEAANGTAVDAPSHYLSICTGVGLNFSDSGQQHTTYRVSVTNPHCRIMSWKRTPSSWSTTSTVKPSTPTEQASMRTPTNKRRCLDSQEMEAKGWELNERGRWVDPVRLQASRAAFAKAA
jgi:hypothetical protein